MNKVFLIGNLTADPELNTSASGTKVAKMTLAINNVTGNANFFRVIAWRTTAENVFKYCHKGDKLAIFGYLQQNQYTDKDGVKRSIIDVIADTVEFINVKQNASQEPNATTKTETKTHPDISQIKKEVQQAFRAAQESRLATEQSTNLEDYIVPQAEIKRIIAENRKNNPHADLDDDNLPF